MKNSRFLILASYGPDALASLLARPLGPDALAALRVRPAGEVAQRAYPVNPFSLAEFKTGKAPRSRAELEAAFGMPLEKILAVGGPLYNPDLDALAKHRPAGAPPRIMGAAPRTKADLSNLSLLSADAPKIGPSMPVDPLGPGERTISPVESEATRAWRELTSRAVTCERWLADSLSTQRQLLGFVGVAPELIDRVADRLSARCRGSATPGEESYRSVNELLYEMRLAPADWNRLTCGEQFAALGRINPRLVPPAVTFDEMKRQLFGQWQSITYALNSAAWSMSPIALWSRVGPYAARTPQVTDPMQGIVGDCFFIASLAGTAWVRPDILMARSWNGRPAPDGSILFADPRSGTLAPHMVTFSDELPVRIDDADLCDGQRPFAHSTSLDTNWPALYEKALRVWITGQDNPPMAVHGEQYKVSRNAHPAILIAGGMRTFINWRGGRAPAVSGLHALARSLTGNNPTEADVWSFLSEHADAEGKVTSVLIAATIQPEWSPVTSIVPSHFYTVLGIDRAVRAVYLRNPWGHISPGPAALQRGEWKGLRLGLDDGVGVVPMATFYDNFNLVSGNYYGTARRWDRASPLGPFDDEDAFRVE